MYEKKYVDYLGHKGTILPRYNGDWVYYDGPDVPSNYPPIRFIASVDTKADPETEKAREEFSEWAGIALCLAKKLYGPNFHKIFRAHCSDPEKTVSDMTDEEITEAAREGIKNSDAK